MAAERLVSARELAELLGVSKAWVVSSTRAERLPGYRIGGVWRFDVAQPARWLDAQGNRSTKPGVSGQRAAIPVPAGAEPPTWRFDLANVVPAQDVADELDVPLDAIKRWVLSGLLPGAHAGPTWSVDAIALAGWHKTLKRHPQLLASRHGKGRAESIGDSIKSELLHRKLETRSRSHTPFYRASRPWHTRMGRSYASPGLTPAGVHASKNLVLPERGGAARRSLTLPFRFCSLSRTGPVQGSVATAQDRCHVMDRHSYALHAE